MAIDKYVDSNAAGTGSGDSWVNAYTTLGAASAVAAGAHVAVAHNHAETSTSPIVVTFTNGTIANPVKVICRNTGTDALATGGSITCTGSNDNIAINGNVYVYGLTLNADEDIKLASENADRYQCYENCTFGHGSSGDAQREIQIGSMDTSDITSSNCDLINCTFNPEVNPVRLGSRGMFRYIGCTFNLEAATGFNGESMHGSYHLMDGCNLAGDANPTTFFTFDNGMFATFHIRNCKLPGTITTSGASTGVNQQFIVENSDDGTITDPPLGLNWFENPYGKVEAVLTHYTDAGASDGEQANNYAWKVVTTANCIENIRGFKLPPIARWVDGGSSITSTLYFASGGTLYDDDIGVDWLNPDTAGSATALPDWTAKRLADFDATPSAHTTTSPSIWNGTGVGTEQEHEITYTPTNAGFTVAHVTVYKPSSTVYFDPQIVNS